MTGGCATWEEVPPRKRVPSTLTVRCPLPLRKKVRIVADKLHVSESSLVLQLIESGLGKHDVVSRMAQLEERLVLLETAIDMVGRRLGDSRLMLRNEAPTHEESPTEPDSQ